MTGSNCLRPCPRRDGRGDSTLALALAGRTIGHELSMGTVVVVDGCWMSVRADYS